VDRCAVFIDAGYLFAAGGELCCGTPARHRLQLDAHKANSVLLEVAKEGCGLPVLRTYWYDGAKGGIPTPTQQHVAALPNMKLRLGRLSANNQQKGVDALIYRDLMTLARERAICEAFLLSGDEDLREGVRAAQDQGVRVTLIGIRPVSQGYNQSRELVHEADEVVQLDQNRLAGAFSLTPTAPQTAQSRQLARVRIASPTRSPGSDFADQWLASATEAQVAALKAQRPRIPRYLDIELLRFAEQALAASLRGQDDQHRALRRSFWTAIDAVPPAAVASAGAEPAPPETSSENPTAGH
jgi:uncharacterized LabA/DUF88 family protein